MCFVFRIYTVSALHCET